MGSESRTLSLFEEPGLPLKVNLGEQLGKYARRNVWIGTSSWKYEGWLGQIYTPDRYTIRGRFSKKRFEQECLAEYAETFPIVCGDFAFYQFPTPEFWKRLFGTSPQQLRFSFKVPEEVTTPAFPSHPRYGARGGTSNPTFLSRSLFEEMFLAPLAPYANRTPLLILEFGEVCGTLFSAAEFTERLASFFEGLPPQFRYAVEIRSPEFLEYRKYFEMLTKYGVAHVLNAWTRMPTLSVQMQHDGIFTSDFTVVRALLTHGRAYADAVRKLSPYREIKQRNPDVRAAIRDILIRAVRRGETAYIFVNNRLEGNAPTTIHEILEETDEAL
jgi:uncharacterized protein YecE (DUF72 family)